MLLLTSEYKYRYYLAPPQSLSRKQIKTMLTLCKLLFIVNVRVKGLLKVILEYKNEASQLENGRGTFITRLYKC